MATIPSIAMIPSGVKAGKLYSVLPTNGAGDFTTTRASVATRVNESGLIEEVAANVPRLDYSDGTCPSLLLEPASTNLITQSEDLATTYVPTDITQTSNYGISPDGTLTSTRVVLSNLTTSRSFNNTTLVNGGTYTFSTYYKGVVGETTYMNFLSAVGGTSISKQITFTGEWQRESVTFTAGSSSNFTYIVDTRQGASTATDFEVWGASLEENSYATSYIKTLGTAQTRSADTATGSGSSTVINSSEGVLYAEISALSDDLTNRFISLIGTTSANSVSLFYGGGSSNFIRCEVKSNNITQSELTTTSYDITNYNKIAIKFSENDFALWVNGVEVATDISGVTPIGLIDFSFDRENSLNFYGKAKSVQVYTTALSDAELTNLTTI